MKKVIPSEIDKLKKEKRFLVLHIDAAWDGYRTKIAKQIEEISEAVESEVSFAYLDCDEQQEYASEINLRNVPSVAYFEGDNLHGLVIGIGQDIQTNIEKIKSGQPLHLTNPISRY